ncbi:hypothetical protein [uncultured Eubacterium sp.]|uniref:hypothetical protein n=1 Tax=uncultured Eubacterium sp. TaxID=165185 RepID=UPI00258D1C39|nr:hypothetical protein [uncultured Eubacterium sp.]
MNKNDFIIRLEQKSDYRNTEILVREVLQVNILRLGCIWLTSKKRKNLTKLLNLSKNLFFPSRCSE